MGNNSFIQSKGKGEKMKKALCKRLRKWDAYIRENCIRSEEIYNNYYFISEKIGYAERQIKSAFSKPSYRIKNISEILKRYEYSINESEFYAEIRHIKLTDEELENLYPLLTLCAQVLSDNPLFFLINSYTTGLQPTVIRNMLTRIMKEHGGAVDAYEVGLPTDEEDIILPCGASAIWKK
jgi:hypothetical protein